MEQCDGAVPTAASLPMWTKAKVSLFDDLSASQRAGPVALLTGRLARRDAVAAARLPPS
jgi:hypothetical protein